MIHNSLQDICTQVQQRHLGYALHLLENYALTHQINLPESFNAVKSDFLLMADYWQRGYDDPMRETLYQNLLQRLYVLTADLDIRWRVVVSAFLRTIHTRLGQTRQDWSASSIRQELETYVSEAALLELEPPHVRKPHAEKLFQTHQQLMARLFDYIITAPLWTEGMAQTFEEMLLSPTVDTVDQQLLVSAMTLSAMQTFDFQKFRVLLCVYRQTLDEPLRQRALVGWVLCADASMATLYDEMPQLVREACEDERCRQELTELQLQLLYCLDAEEDTQRIQKEIIPDIMNGSNLKMTHKGLVEMDEDTLEEILHPEAAEQNLERMEQSMQRMVDMQKKGADIYFGGFSQMKRFPFFNDLANWFVPYYPQHPAVSRIIENTRGRKFLDIITKIGAFCDSDKYSFVLAFDQVLERIPDSMLKLIDEGEATPMPLGGEISMAEQHEPAFIRRMYLQNLYRFYRVYPARSEFRNPFDIMSEHRDYIIFANPLFNHTALQQHYMEVAGFMMKRKMYGELMAVLNNGDELEKDFSYYMTMGSLLLTPFHKDADRSFEAYRNALQLKPDNEKAQACYARALFKREEYEEALRIFEALMAKKPEHAGYQLNTAVCMTQIGRYEDAMKILFKLNYEHPEDLSVLRVLAWTETLEGKYEQALKHYHKLLDDTDKPQPEDLLNNGFCLWLSRDIKGAVALFQRYVDEKAGGVKQIETEFFVTEHQILSKRHISATEIRLMLDMIN